MNQLSRLRKCADMRQMDVAKALKIDTSTVAKWETGASMPRADKLPTLAKLYGCTVDALLSEENTKAGVTT